MTEQLTIARLGHRGDGIADTPAGPVYVPYALPGETVTVEPVAGHPDRRHLDHVDKPSHERVEPICKHFTQCGGCAMQHWSLAEYHLWKRGLVAEALAQANVVAPLDPLIDAHGLGRRRAVLHARRGTGDLLEVGFTAPRAHHIVAIDTCPILAPGLAGAIPAAWAIAEILKPAAKPLDIQVTATDSGMDVDVRGSGPLNANRTTALAGVAESTGSRASPATANWWRKRAAAVESRPRKRTAAAGRFPASNRRRRSDVSAASDRACWERQARRRPVLRHRHFRAQTGRTRARIRRRQRRAGGEGAQQAAAKTSGLKPVEAQARDLFRRPFMAAELKGFDAVVFDPPRHGAEAQARELVKSGVPIVVAVSCDATTFARDAKSWSTAATRSRASRRSTSSAIRFTSRSWASSRSSGY